MAKVVAPFPPASYTFDMKTGISIPDELFKQADKHARRAGISRSQVFSRALQDYLARHAPDEVTGAMDRTLAETGQFESELLTSAARRVLMRIK